jgi:saccharopine dehydrogenase-like NADP-dependent oxidoreductase
LPTTDPAAPNRLRRALVLGAGRVGFAVAFDLSQQQSCDVTVVDTAETRLARLAGLRHVTTTRVDANEVTALRALASAHDVVVGALPSVLGYRTLEALIGACPAIVDISFMPEDALALDAVARRAGTTVVVDCGVAPGLSHMMVGDAVRRVDECRSVKILVGGLPAHPGGLFDYKAGFSPYDVIEEYVRPARIVEEFEVIAREGLSGLEFVEVPGVGTLEAFLTDGLRTLTTTIKARSMYEKTLRYPGHAQAMRAFREAGFFSKEATMVCDQRIRPLDVTAALLFPRWTFGDEEADVTVLKVLVEGTSGSNRLTCSWELIDRYDPAARLHSMARTTAFPAAIVAALVANGALPAGVHPPETLGRAGLLDGVAEQLAVRGVHCTAAIRWESEPAAGGSEGGSQSS